MTFTNSVGTRGKRQPGGTFLTLINRLIMHRLRRNGGNAPDGSSTLILNTLGARSGQTRTNPVQWFDDGRGGWFIVASAAGAARNPAWFHNIAAHPDSVVIETGGELIPVTARQLHGQERAEGWSGIARSSSRFRNYQQQTDRELPLIRLTRRHP